LVFHILFPTEAFMLFTKATYLGIDPSAGGKPFVYVALDQDRRMLALGQGSLDDVLAFAAGQQECLAAVCAPPRPNLGLMRRDDLRQTFSPPPHPGRWEDLRLADFLLRRHNLSIPHTHADEASCPNWMRMGFQVHHRLEALGYCPYPHDQAVRQSLEVYPYACYAALLGVLPLPKHTLEGRLQRQLILHDLKLHVPDPMDFFEEVTRHKLLKGTLPLDMLFTPGELDALVAAYTAWLAASHPEQVSLLGDPVEGQVTLPAAELKDF
jgi:hypothetical protein